jgi:hypothetical protein
MSRLHYLAVGLLTLLAPGLRAEDKTAGKRFPPIEIGGQLAAVDPTDRKRNLPCKLHRVDFVKGRMYVLDMISSQFDAYLRLEDPAGLELAEDDDSGGNLNSRITFTARSDGSYRIVATTFNGQVGAYSLKIREVMPP